MRGRPIRSRRIAVTVGLLLCCAITIAAQSSSPVAPMRPQAGDKRSDQVHPRHSVESRAGIPASIFRLRVCRGGLLDAGDSRSTSTAGYLSSTTGCDLVQACVLCDGRAREPALRALSALQIRLQV